MADEPTIDLAFIGQAPSARPVGRACLGQPLQRLTNEVASFRDDMRVLTAIVMRLDNSYARLDSSQAMLLSEMREIRQELRAMHAQHQCTAERVRALEER
jgi:dsDNA-specific endonuclease/ATPase MutS2